jgi:hypothetical protein
MAELVDAADSKSAALTGVRVRLSLRAPRDFNRLRSFFLPELIPQNDQRGTFAGTGYEGYGQGRVLSNGLVRQPSDIVSYIPRAGDC